VRFSLVFDKFKVTFSDSFCYQLAQKHYLLTNTLDVILENNLMAEIVEPFMALNEML